MSRAARIGAFIVRHSQFWWLVSSSSEAAVSVQLHVSIENPVRQCGGLDAGGDVRVGGVHSGTVRDIVLPHKPGDKVTVVMDLSKSTQRLSSRTPLHQSKRGAIGNQYLAISFGTAGAANVRGGDVIASQPPLECQTCSKDQRDS